MATAQACKRIHGSISRLFRFDLEAAEAAGAVHVLAGADEAGRGALAGPLVAAAVCFDYRSWRPRDYRALAGLTDSKKLTSARREELLAEIMPRATQVSVVACSAASIDERGLHRCNLQSLGAALQALSPTPALLHVDGFSLRDCPLSHCAIIGGDGLSAVVAAASIVAKVSRDRLMRSLHRHYPQWGFDEHVGYATPGHHEAILRSGLCELHRRSFASVAYQQLALTWGEDPPVEVLPGPADEALS